MRDADRLQAIQNCHDALKAGGVFIFFENFAPDSEYARKTVLDRWGRYQKDHGKSDAEVADHIGRYGKNYFPITLAEHHHLLRDTGFRHMEIFWLSYMQVGMYAVK
jgi:tRNA (cmo5U34)-methyltransferase